MTDITPSIDPRREDLPALLARLPSGQPVVMLNLLRFRERAEYLDSDEEVSGVEAYQRYSERAGAFVAAVGGELQWLGSARSPLIAPHGEDWHKVMLVRYPSIEKFVEMLRDPDYQAITFHRTAALSDSRLIACLED